LPPKKIDEKESMNYFKQFVIQFSGLSIGEHHFDFEVTDEFFEKIEYSEINKGNVKIDVLLSKQENMLVFMFSMKGKVNVICDRCSYPFDIEISGDKKLLVKFGNETYEETDEILIIPETDYQIDLYHYVYEYINLLLPIKKVHPEDNDGNSTCNPKVIKKLEELENQNPIDSRWNELKKLKNNKFKK
jgi:uncharacterized metal-binding protein YceD (DUF177 family)